MMAARESDTKKRQKNAEPSSHARQANRGLRQRLGLNDIGLWHGANFPTSWGVAL
jgi:hypothetical protein